jgi:hypoxia up-regulated 1
MLPPGRRRKLFLSPLLALSFLFLLITPTSAISAVLGIDLGTEYFKATLVKPGIPGEIVLTKDSKRKESAALAFKPSRSQSAQFPERLYGGDALAVAARFPGDVYSNLKPLLGVGYGDEVVGVYGERYPGLTIVDGGRGTVGFKSGSFAEKEEAFLVEELLAMELKNIRANAEVLAGKGSTVRDAVITFPAFYTAEEKRAVQLAAELAGLRLLGLISDGLAVGVNYATTRTFPSVNEGGKPEYHLVFDMGAGSTTATVLRFQGRTVKDVGRFNKTIQEVQVLGTGWDRTLGGDALNQLIVDDMITKFVETKMKAMNVAPTHVKKHPRTVAKLWKESERLRQVLSANSETSASFEGLFYDDVNFKYKLSRVEFENLAAEHASRVSNPLTQALDAAKLSYDDLESIILHGGAARTPFVQKQLEIAVGGSSKIRSNVNADESAVFGAAFKGAGLSGGYRVKDIRTGDSPGYAVGLKWTYEGKERSQKLFTSTSQIGAEKQVPLKTLEDFEFILTQNLPTTSSDPSESPVAKIKTKNLTASVTQLKDKYGCAPVNITAKISIRLSPFDNLPEVTRGTVSCEVEGPEKKGGVVDDVKGFFGFGSKKSDKEQEPLVDSSSSSTTTDTSTTSSTSSSSSSSTTASSKSTKDKDSKSKEKDSGPRTITIPISLVTTPLGTPAPSEPEMTRILTRLAAFDTADKSRILHSEGLNTLEAFTYRARDLLTDDSFISASTSKARAELEKKLAAASDWIYADGVDATYEVVKEKLKALEGLVEPVLKRKDETLRRPEGIKALRDALGQTKSLIDAVKEQIEKEAAESSSASAAAETASASSTESSSSSEPSPSASEDNETDPFSDLDSDPYSSTSTTSSSNLPPPTPNPYISPYTLEDLTALQSAYDSAMSWLENKLVEQEKLSPADDPVLLVAELEKKAREQSKQMIDVLTKKVKMPVPPKGSKAKAPKTKTAKANKGKDKEEVVEEKTKGQLGDEGFEGLKVEELEEIVDEVPVEAKTEKGKEGGKNKKKEKAKPKNKDSKKTKDKKLKEKGKKNKDKDEL